VRECGGGLALLISRRRERGRETSACGHNQYRRHRPCPSWLVVGSLSVGRAGIRKAAIFLYFYFNGSSRTELQMVADLVLLFFVWFV
jgi:hypothetical protein